MTKSQVLWAKSTRLLSDPKLFNSERARVLESYPLLNSHGLGQTYHHRHIDMEDGGLGKRRVTTLFPEDLKAAREDLQAGGRYEQGIRNTLEYFVEGRISLSYRLRWCGWARHFNGPAPPRRSSYVFKHSVESYLRKKDQLRKESGETVENNRYTANGAFICAALMTGVRIWCYRGSINPDLRLGEPWAVAGLQPEDYGHPRDEYMAKFWRWVVQQDIQDPVMKDFIADTAGLLYDGANLEQLQKSIEHGCWQAREVYDKLRSKFGLEPGYPPTIIDEPSLQCLGFLAGQIKVPDDFNRMGNPEIEQMFGKNA